MTVLIRHEGAACGCDARDVSPGLLSVDAARTAALRLVVPVTDREQVPLAQALGRVLAQPLRAQAPMPPFDASAVDGYAVRLDDLIGPGLWTLALQDRVAAGDGRAIRFGSGALRIFTDAPLPSGAPCVTVEIDLPRSRKVFIEPAPHDTFGYQRPQLRPTIEGAQRPYALRVHMQMLDFRTRKIHPQPNPSNAGTEQLGYSRSPLERSC